MTITDFDVGIKHIGIDWINNKDFSLAQISTISALETTYATVQTITYAKHLILWAQSMHEKRSMSLATRKRRTT